MTPEDATSLVDAWYRLFGTAPVTVRRVLTVAIDEDEALLSALTQLPEFPHPKALSRWLSKHENSPCRDGHDEPYRFCKEDDAGRWRLLPAPALMRISVAA